MRQKYGIKSKEEPDLKKAIIEHELLMRFC